MRSRSAEVIARQISNQACRSGECARRTADPDMPGDVRLASTEIIRTSIGTVRRTLDVHGRAAGQHDDIVPLPAAECVIECLRHVPAEYLPAAEGQFVNRACGEDVALIVVRIAPLIIQQGAAICPDRHAIGRIAQRVRGVIRGAREGIRARDWAW
jgi:hypothetical protein